MRIGITYDLKGAVASPTGAPDDDQEEFDSPATIEAIAAVLRGLGHDVDMLGNGRELLERLLADPPDFVFNFAEGHGISRSREARVPAVLEMLGIPYTGSDPFTLALALDKHAAKLLVAPEVPIPWGLSIPPDLADHHVCLLKECTSLSGAGQAGLGGIEQGHPFQLPGPHLRGAGPRGGRAGPKLPPAALGGAIHPGRSR